MDNTIFEAKRLYDNKQYSSALPLYKQLYEEDPNDKWVAWFYSRCLKECGELGAAIDIAAFSHESNPEFDVNNKLLAYMVNDKYFKNSSSIISKEEALVLVEKAEFLATLVRHEEKSPLEFCIFQTLKIAKKVFLTGQTSAYLIC